MSAIDTTPTTEKPKRGRPKKAAKPAKAPKAPKVPKASNGDTDKKKRHRKRDYQSFGAYILELQKKMSPDFGIKKKTLCVLDDIVHDLLTTLSTKAANVAKHNKMATIKTREVAAAVALAMPKEVADFAKTHAMKSVATYEKACDEKGERTSRRKKAGLIVSVSRVDAFLRKSATGMRVGGKTPVYLAGVIEYVLSELLDGAIKVAADQTKKRLSPRHIMLARANDSDMLRFLQGFVCDAGMLPVATVKQKKKTGMEKKD